MTARSTTPGASHRTRENVPQDNQSFDLAARAHFGSVSFRPYDDIWTGDHVKQVIEGPKTQLDQYWQLFFDTASPNYARLFFASVTVLGLVLNTWSTTRRLIKGLPDLHDLIINCLHGNCFCFSDDTAAWWLSWSTCQDGGEVTAFHIILALFEFVTVWYFLCRAGYCFAFAQVNNDDEHRWNQIARGLHFTEQTSAASALQILPWLQNKTKEGFAPHKSGIFGAWLQELEKHKTLVLFLKIILYVVCFLGAFVALYLKVKVNHQEVFTQSVESWSRYEWWEFLNFTHQMQSVVPVSLLQKDLMLRFVFSGEDAVMDRQELKARKQFQGRLNKYIFERFEPWRAVAYSLTISAQDLQKMVLVEKHD
jgi:hypothetical protein